MQRFIVLVVALCLLPSMALARTWTNREGKEIVADFVDATDEKVTLKKSDGKVVTFKLELLSEDDQNFIRGILARRVGRGSSGSSDEPDSPFESVESPAKPARRDSKSPDLKSIVEPKSTEKVEGLGTMRDVDETKKKLKPENREWNDAFGNKSSGKFIRIVGNNVLVLRSGRQVPLDYWQLSDDDKDYLKELAEANGWSHLIPKINPAEQRNNAPGSNLAGGPAVGPATGMGPSSMPRMSPPGSFPGPASQPATSLPPSIPPGASNPEDLAKRLRELENINRSTPTYTPPSSVAAGSPAYSSPGGTSYTPPPSSTAGYGAGPGPSSSPSPGPSSTPGTFNSPAMTSSLPSSSMPSPYSMPGPSMPGPVSMPNIPDPTANLPSFTMEKQCENCGKVLPASFTAGDTCPGCGVYFSHDDTNGKTSHQGIFGGGGRGGSGPSRGAIKGIIVLVVLGIKGIAFMVWRSQQGSS